MLRRLPAAGHPIPWGEAVRAFLGGVDTGGGVGPYPRVTPTRSGTAALAIALRVLRRGSTRDEVVRRLDEVLSGGFREDRRRTLDVRVLDGRHRGLYRALNDAVGFNPSSLTHRRAMPISRARAGSSCSGVMPSPSDTGVSPSFSGSTDA